MTVARHRLADTRGAGESAYAARAVLPMGETRTRYHVALDVDDRAGVLAAVATAFAEHGVSIQTVRQEGRGADAQLVVVSHQATDAQLQRDGRGAAGDGRRARGVLGDARRRGGRVSVWPTHQWRGVIEEYRPLFDLLPEGLPADHPGEGGTPLVHSEWLSGLTGGTVWLKVEGNNPTGSFKDRGMTTAISVAKHEGAEAVVCASTGNTSASMAAYAAKAGLKPLVLIPEGKIAAGKMAQAIVHGAQIIMVRGNFDHCLQMARALSWDYPVALVNSVNPVRLQGQKTAAFEIVDYLEDAPDYHLLPVGQRRQHLGVLAGLRAVLQPRSGHQEAGDARLPGRGRRAAGDRGALPRPGDQGDRDPDRQPRLLEARRGGRRRVRRPVRCGQPTSRSSTPRPSSRARDGVFVEPASAAGVAGILAEVGRHDDYSGKTVVLTVTGHGLKDTATALEGAGELVDVVVDADVEQAAKAAGLD